MHGKRSQGMMQPVACKGDDEKHGLVESESESLKFHVGEREGEMAIERHEKDASCRYPSCQAELSAVVVTFVLSFVRRRSSQTTIEVTVDFSKE
jgi:hypothetical protein